jgi:hypothetical protein
MWPLGWRLAEAGYAVVNLGYPSRGETPEALVEHLAAELEACCRETAGSVHFVAYSLGGVLLRAYLEEERPEKLGRVVLLASPSSGSEVVDTLGAYRLFRAFFGPTALALGTEEDSFPNRLGPPDYELGVIAGSSSINPLGSWLIPGPDDGAVSIESAQVEGMADFLVLPESHFFLLWDERVAEEVVHFLRHGRFAPAEKSDDADAPPPVSGSG